ncbi:LysE family translocator [Morganella morganii]|nr:LysE family translocator [Morganella morganii]
MVFGATVLPIVFAPGPDILFVSSQGLASGSRAALKANMGVLLGYGMHSILAAFGLAAVVVASPVLFNGMRWFGVAYIAYLAFRMVMSAMHKSEMPPMQPAAKSVITKGFFYQLPEPERPAGLLCYPAELYFRQ